jgi:NusA-like KH domain protein
MSKITYNNDLLKIMSLFENVTRVELKDSFVDANGMLTFIVKENDIGKAIGKKASNVRNLERLLMKRIKIVEFNPDVVKFAKNMIAPLMAEDITVDNDKVMIKGADMRTKGLLIGRNSQNIRNLENILGKYFNIKSVRVI